MTKMIKLAVEKVAGISKKEKSRKVNQKLSKRFKEKITSQSKSTGTHRMIKSMNKIQRL